MLRKLLAALTMVIASQTGHAQLHPLNEATVDIIGHSLGAGFTYRRTLDYSYMNHWHGFVTVGATNGLLSNYVGLGYRYGDEYCIELEALAGYNSLFGRRLRKDDPNAIRSGLSYGAHINLGAFTFDHYTARMMIGYHHFQDGYPQFILGMQVGRFFD